MRGIELTPDRPVADLVELGVAGEGAGFDAIFTSCHYNNRDPFIALSQIAAATETIQVGPGVANPYDAHPVALASSVATLQEVSGGRAHFGLGAGDRSTLANLGVERDRPLRRVLETMQVARKLWAGERVTHDGTFQTVDAGLNYEPTEAESIPVYVGAQGPHMLRMAAKYADGVLINASHPADVAWAVDQVDDGLSTRPDERGNFDVLVFASVSVAKSKTAAVEAARPPVAFIAGGANPRVLERHGIDAERATAVGTLIEEGSFAEAFEAVTPAMIDAFCVAGTPEAVAEKLEAIGEYADGIVAGSPLGPDPLRAVGLIAGAFDASFGARTGRR